MRKILLACLALALLGGASVATLTVLSPSGAEAPDVLEPAAGPLDDLHFAGTLRARDGSSSTEDTLHFRDGHFWSASCIVCSFRPGAYWSRSGADGAVDFVGTLESPDRGRFDYRGSVRDGEIEVSIRWTRDRWYWTLERDYVFVGRSVDGADAPSLAAAAARADGMPLPACPI